MKWFTEREFRCRCCGELPEEVKGNVMALVNEVLDPVREKLGVALVVNSGYRCKEHNLRVGGAKGSQHLRGEAADVRLVSGSKFQVSGVQDLARAIVELGRFDQVIVYPTFVHVSWKRFGPNRKQVLRKISNGYQRL